MADTGREALEDMRRLVEVLRGSSPGDEQSRTRDSVETLVERAPSAGVSVTVTVSGSAGELPPAVELSVFRIVQEALTNVLRHARPGATVELGLGYPGDAVTVSVVDDGGTTNVRSQLPTTNAGHGLVGMRERVNVHGGAFSAGPTATGWAVAATIPLRAAATA